MMHGFEWWNPENNLISGVEDNLHILVVNQAISRESVRYSDQRQ